MIILGDHFEDLSNSEKEKNASSRSSEVEAALKDKRVKMVIKYLQSGGKPDMHMYVFIYPTAIFVIPKQRPNPRE